MFSNLNNYQEVGTQTDREAQVIEFNNQYNTYNRKNVRGSDLYSLLNRVISYNRRKTEKATKTTDEGGSIGYIPMTITVYIKQNREAFSVDGKNPQLITKTEYVQSENENQFVESIDKNVTEAEKKLRWERNCTKISNSGK